jgi:putative Mn2+ efflux pump MntP
MALITIIGIAFGLAMDAFAVSIAVGSRMERLSFRPLFRLSFHFGLFQFIMPIIGWAIGSRIEYLIKAFDHWVAFGLLFYIGAKMIYESIAKSENEGHLSDPTRKWSLIILSIATSIDALAVGLSIALLGIDIWFISLVIGIVASAMTAIGMMFGRKLGLKFGKRMEFFGGLILIGIGLKILIGHIFI